MPAADLDKYLAEFFSVVKRTDGMEYGAHRLSCLRSNLERFLKENNYPYSIIKSLEFFNSQAAFQAKRKSVHNYVWNGFWRIGVDQVPLVVIQATGEQMSTLRQQVLVDSQAAQLHFRPVEILSFGKSLNGLSRIRN